MEVASPIPRGPPGNYAIPSYSVRHTFPLNILSFQYSNTEKQVDLKGKLVDQSKMELFWKHIYSGCDNFQELRKYARIPKISLCSAILLLIIGLALLIVGTFPIWGADPYNVGLVVLAGICIGVSLLQYTIGKIVYAYYHKRYVYPKYEEAIASAVHKYLEEYINEGLSWKGGKDGFRCIEFWYAVDDGNPSITNQSLKQDGTMYSEAIDMIRKGNSTEQSVFGIKTFTKEGELRITDRDNQEPFEQNSVDDAFSKNIHIRDPSPINQREIERFTSRALLDDTTACTTKSHLKGVNLATFENIDNPSTTSSIKKLNGNLPRKVENTQIKIKARTYHNTGKSLKSIEGSNF